MTQSDPLAPDTRNFAVPTIIAIMLLGLLPRVFCLESECAWHDEVLTLQALPAPDLPGFWQALQKNDPPVLIGPVYFTLAYYWARMFGGTTLSMRLFSVALSMLSIPLLYAVGKRLYGPGAGCVAALFMALSMSQVYYAQEIRMYALTGVLVLLSVMTFLDGVRTGSILTWFTHWLVNAVLLGTHIFAAPLIAVMGLYLFLSRPGAWWRWFSWGAAHILLLTGMAVWIRYTATLGATHQAFWSPMPAWREAANLILILAGGRFSNEDPAGYFPSGLSLDRPLAAVMIVAIGGLALRVLQGGHAENEKTAAPKALTASGGAFAFLGLWLIGPPVMLFLMSRFVAPCFLYRYLLYCAFPLFLLVGGAVSALPRSSQRVGVLTIIAGMSVYQFTEQPFPFRPAYQQVDAFIHEYGAPLDPVFCFKQINSVPYGFLTDIPKARQRQVEGFDDLCSKVVDEASQGRNVWVVFWRWDRMEDFEKQMRSAGLGYYSSPFGGVPPVYLYCVGGRSSGPPEDMLIAQALPEPRAGAGS